MERHTGKIEIDGKNKLKNADLKTTKFTYILNINSISVYINTL